MQKLPLLLLMLLGHYAGAQSIWFQLHRTNGCTNETTIDSSDYYLVDKMGTGYRNTAGTVWLPATGEYEIYFPKRQDNHIYPVIKITGNKNLYTHYDGKVKLKYTDAVGNSFFHDCNGRINGYKEDYFENGVISLKGHFAEGEPKDSLLLFYPNGNIRKNIVYLKKEIYIREYDSLANIIKQSRKSNKPTSKGYYYHTTTTYYPDGGLKSEETTKEDILTITEYYPDKRIKSELTKDKKTEYYANGNIRTETKWKLKPDKNMPFSFSNFEIVKRFFYQDGKISEEIIYQTVQPTNHQPDISLSKADFFILWKRISLDGAENILFRDKFQHEILKSDTFLELLNQPSNYN